MEDINNTTYANIGWYPDYIQTIYKPTFYLKVNQLKTILIIIITRILIIIMGLITKLSKHNKDINKDNNQNSNNSNNKLV